MTLEILVLSYLKARQWKAVSARMGLATGELVWEGRIAIRILTGQFLAYFSWMFIYFIVT